MILSLTLIIILSIVQGLTEFIPVSSTGHMVVIEKLFSMDNFSDDFFTTFLVMVQLPSILAVIVFFWNEISPFQRSSLKFDKQKIILWTKIVVGIIPTAIFGILLDDWVSNKLYTIPVISTMLILYGIFFLMETKYLNYRKNSNNEFKEIISLEGITYKKAILAGLFQTIAIIPGTSRSGATIIGGLLLGFSRSIAAEFSFFLAIPTMFGATLLRFLKHGLNFSSHEWFLISIGCIISYIVSFSVIKWLMKYLKRNTFKVFGIYRIVIGILLLLFVSI